MTPDFKLFKKHYSPESPQIVSKHIVLDLDTPVSASLKLMRDNQFFFLLESVESGESRGRYSIIGMDPNLIWKWEKDACYLSHGNSQFEFVSNQPIQSLRQLIKESQFELPKGIPSMSSGLFGFLSYDAIRYIEPTVGHQNPDSIQIPMSVYARPRLVLVFDSVFGTLHLVYTLWPSDKHSAEQDYQHATSAINAVIDSLKQPLPKSLYSPSVSSYSSQFKSNFTQESFETMVKTCKDYIVAGDIFQIVPSQRFNTPFTPHPFSFYRSLRHLNPSPSLFYLNFFDFQLIGSSPEIMVKLQNNKMTIRPLAGTRPRGKTPEEDTQLATDLLSDQKELSEHLMLVDLSRHDVGKVCKPGTVKVTEQMIIEYYSHVMHISSNVEGELDPQYDMLDALLSGLPLGTVSGAPKIRAMQIIEEQEPELRSFYAGCVGYFSSSGEMETCVTLRTSLIKDKTLYIQAGCGVVADSDPHSEYEETLNKAKALMKATEYMSHFSYE